jgi:hypothetical protein
MQMHEFSKQNAKMGMTAEMMDDAMEDMFEVDEGEADDLVNQVCTAGDFCLLARGAIWLCLHC